MPKRKIQHLQFYDSLAATATKWTFYWDFFVNFHGTITFVIASHLGCWSLLVLCSSVCLCVCVKCLRSLEIPFLHSMLYMECGESTNGWSGNLRADVIQAWKKHTVMCYWAVCLLVCMHVTNWWKCVQIVDYCGKDKKIHVQINTGTLLYSYTGVWKCELFDWHDMQRWLINYAGTSTAAPHWLVGFFLLCH